MHDTLDATVQRFAERIRDATARHTGLRLRAGGSKDALGGTLRGEQLQTDAYAGIVAHDPGELILRARAGTPLAEIDDVLAQHGQCLPFDPPRLGGHATLGGAVASGLGGPLRASLGSARDHVLGVRLMDGRGERLSFGGPVIKNVAGYDVSRLMAGSWGALGILLDLTIRLMPVPAGQRTLSIAADQRDAIARMNRLLAQGDPVLSSAWHGGTLYLRLGGARAHVAQALHYLGGEKLDEGEADALWRAIRDQQHRFFAQRPAAARLWRFAVPSTAAPLELPGDWLLEAAGSKRWLASDAEPARVHAVAAAAGGYALRFLGAPDRRDQCPALPVAVLRVQQQLKRAFDPHGVFNPGRLHPEL